MTVYSKNSSNSFRSYFVGWKAHPPLQAMGGLRPHEALAKCGGDDWRNFEPISRPRTTASFHRIDRIVRGMRRIYKKNPSYFDVPAFARKIY
jgi:hypothetical protein